MLDLAERLQALGFAVDADFVLQDDGEGAGPQIAQWLSNKKRPTQAQLAAVTLPDPTRVAMQPLAPYQFRAMLKIAGKEGATLAAIAALEDGQAKAVAESKLEFALAFHRTDPLIAMLAPAVGLTDEQIDGMWADAQAL